MGQKEEGNRERLMSLVIQKNVTPGFWKPYFVTQLSTPSEGGPRSSGREEAGDVVDFSCLGRQYLLDQSFGPVTITFPVTFWLSHVAKESRPQNCAVGWFDYISIVLTVIYGVSI